MALAAALLAVPVTAYCEVRSVHDQPRSIDILDGRSGDSRYPPDRYATFANPQANELGFLRVLRIFRSVCLDLERGEKLASVMPESFAAYSWSLYDFGDPQRH